jgi:hypothetical protein
LTTNPLASCQPYSGTKPPPPPPAKSNDLRVTQRKAKSRVAEPSSITSETRGKRDPGGHFTERAHNDPDNEADNQVRDKNSSGLSENRVSLMEIEYAFPGSRSSTYASLCKSATRANNETSSNSTTDG